MPALYAATAGYEIVEEIGIERIRENSMRQTALFIGLLDEAGFEVVSPREPERRGGSVVVRVPDFLAVHAELESRQILLDVRPDVGLRFGPHFFNSDEELESAAAALVDIVGSPHAGPPSLRPRVRAHRLRPAATTFGATALLARSV